MCLTGDQPACSSTAVHESWAAGLIFKQIPGLMATIADLALDNIEAVTASGSGLAEAAAVTRNALRKDGESWEGSWLSTAFAGPTGQAMGLHAKFFVCYMCSDFDYLELDKAIQDKRWHCSYGKQAPVRGLWQDMISICV
nr:hypothetical protein CFP56_31641 [Quercus suber]